MIQKITPFLWFDKQAEEAANFYVSIFRNSKITGVTHYDESSAKASGQPAGSVMTVSFQLEGQDFVALNGGPVFTFTNAVSFVVNCDTQEEIDYYWDRLSDGGEVIECGWLKDRYGLAWQVTPAIWQEFLSDPDPEKAKRYMEALMKMKKLDIAELKRAWEGK